MTVGQRRASYFGNPFIGMFAATNDSHTLFPLEAQDKFVERVSAALGTSAVRCSIGASSLNGIYTAMNSNGIVLPHSERKNAAGIGGEAGIEALASAERMNAHGNNIAVNDRGGIISERVSARGRKEMEECLGVELVPMHIGGYSTVGSLCIATNKGFLVHYAANDEEIKEMEGIFKVGGMKGTANMGTGFVSICLLANSRGYVAGEKTSAYEMGRAEEALGFLG